MLGSTLLFPLGACETARPGPARRLRRWRVEGWPPLVITLPRGLPVGPAASLGAALAPTKARLDAHALAPRESVEIRLHQDAQSFARDTGQAARWLRAWTTYATIHLLPESHWRKRGATARIQRLSHELCHVALYQAFGSAQRARQAAMPRWFQEGVASVVAGQGAQRAPVSLVHKVVKEADPVCDAGWWTRNHHIAYAAAHHAMAALLQHAGSKVFSRVLARATAQGGRGSIQAALRAECDLSPEDLWPLALSLASPDRADPEQAAPDPAAPTLRGTP